MMHHVMVKTNGRRPSENFKKFSYIINSISPRCLRVLRTHLPFPCKESLRVFVSDKYNNMQTNLMTLNKVWVLTNTYFQSITNSKYNFENDVFNATLAVDAVAILPQNLKEIARECGVKIVRSAFNTQFLKIASGKKDIRPDQLTINNLFVFYVQLMLIFEKQSHISKTS